MGSGISSLTYDSAGELFLAVSVRFDYKGSKLRKEVSIMSFAKRTKLALFLLVGFVVAQSVHAQWQSKLEDVSPGPGSTAGDGDSLSGKMLTIVGTGLEGSVGPPTSWSTPNNGVVVDHVAAADKDGHLVLFYSYPGSDWKAVNVMEKTNAAIANVRPESWVLPDGQDVLERIAAPSPSGDLLLFTWHAGSDWTVTNLTTMTNRKIVGPVTSWQVPLGDRMVEHIGARGIDNHFLVFWRIAGGNWGLVDVSGLTGGQQVGGSGTSWKQNLGSEWADCCTTSRPEARDSGQSLSQWGRLWSMWRSRYCYTSPHTTPTRSRACRAGPTHSVSSRPLGASCLPNCRRTKRNRPACPRHRRT